VFKIYNGLFVVGAWYIKDFAKTLMNGFQPCKLPLAQQNNVLILEN
jgi:hypothetical protein